MGSEGFAFQSSTSCYAACGGSAAPLQAVSTFPGASCACHIYQGLRLSLITRMFRFESFTPLPIKKQCNALRHTAFFGE